jgi:hypothetical protein
MVVVMKKAQKEKRNIAPNISLKLLGAQIAGIKHPHVRTWQAIL